MSNLMHDERTLKYNKNSPRHDFDNRAYIWTGTRRSNYSQLTDENGHRFSSTEFLQKFGLYGYVEGDIFPSSVILTKDFRLRTLNYPAKCLCLCKTVDIPIWPIFFLILLLLISTTVSSYFRFRSTHTPRTVP